LPCEASATACHSDFFSGSAISAAAFDAAEAKRACTSKLLTSKATSLEYQDKRSVPEILAKNNNTTNFKQV
jgi:hypothetical protein